MNPREQGQVAGEACLESTQKAYPAFAAVAIKLIVERLHRGPMTGEELTDYVKSRGAIPKDDRAFGPVFSRLAREGIIRSIGMTTRKKGHGTSGARIWALVS